MSFVRPEARDAIWRAREILVGLAVLILGAVWALGSGLLSYIGIVIVALAAALIVVGIQRTRFRIKGAGPGVVRVDEGQIAYFGPLNGGVVAASEIERLALDPTQRPAHWVLQQAGQNDLHIPVTAEGADALFDVFATLPGLRTGRMLAELKGKAIHPVVIWERAPLRPPHLPLH